MKAKLNIKEQNFLKHYLATSSISEAAKLAGSKGKDVSSLYQAGRAIIDRLGITYQDILELNGLTEDFLSKKLAEGASCDKVEIATFRGKIVDEKAFPDYSTRSKYIDMIHRVKGAYQDKIELSGRGGGDISLVIVSPKSKKRSLDID